MPTPLPLNRLYLSQTLSEPAFSPAGDALVYVRLADGRRSLIRQWLAGGLAEPLTTEPGPAGGVGYGGGIFAQHGDLLVYAARTKLVGLDTRTGEQWDVSPAYEGVAAPVCSPCGRYVAFLAEQNNRANVLLVDVRGQQLPVKLSADPWYAFNPAFAPDGARLAWMEWDEFDMPWDETRLVVADLARPLGSATLAAQALPLRARSLGKPRVALASPQFSPDGQWLAYTSDESGWRSLWVLPAHAESLAEARRLDTGQGEIGGPEWAPGQVRVRWSQDSQTLFAIRRHESRDHLLRLAWPAGDVTALETGCTWVSSLAAMDGCLAFIGATPTRPETLATLDLATGQVTPRATNAVGQVDPASLSTPEVLSWETAGGQRAWGIWYPAQTEKSGPRPLLVQIHGGPTSERPLIWEPQAQYFATRGWHVLVVNHRGGTGFGRAYQDQLNGQWGVVDVEDARSGAELLVQRGQADRERVVITGGSAGGYTTLMALAQQPDFWAAGVSLFGIGDMYQLKQGSHRFEVNYEEGLIGRLPEAGPLWKQRSPLTHVKNVRAPVLLFHGKDDQAVPYQQSVDFAEAVRRGGGVAELVLYDGEGHGFMREATRRDMAEKMEAFLNRYVIAMQR